MRTSFILISGVATSLLASVLIACGGSEPSGGESGTAVVVSTPQLTDLASRVAGDRAGVTGVLGVDSDPHEYEPQPADAEALSDADLVVRSGGDVDAWLDDLTESSGTDAPELTVLDEVEVIEGGHDHDHSTAEHSEEAHDEEAHDEAEDIDPHWWQNPENAITAVAAIERELSEVDPEGAAEYRRNADAYIEQLERLDAEVERCFDRVPATDRRLVTSHDALGYYADRYGIEVIGTTIPALTTQAQPSAGETVELIREIREAGVTTIFPEAGLSGDLEEAIAEQANARVGDELWTDSLGPEGSDGETYVDAMLANTEKLVEAFSDGKVRCRFTR